VPDERIHSVPNGVADPFPDGLRREPRGRAEPLTVLYLGMLFEPKGFLDLLRAAAEFRDSDPPVHFVFAGEWYSEDDRREAVRVGAELGIEIVEGAGAEAEPGSGQEPGRSKPPLVAFPGRVDGEAKRALFEAADLLVFPGYQPEGLPLVILEAMAAGLPVISTDTGATRDVVVDGETGMIVEKERPDELSAAIRRLADDEALRLRLGGAGRERYLEEYTREQSTRRLVALFDLISEKDRV
jgi:glycosyltransferase involved in cell wall biosynthesis